MKLSDVLFLVLALVLFAGAMMLSGCAGNSVLNEVPSMHRILSETPKL